MSISGNLVDVTVADVMQFVHLGGRTGTLSIKRPDHEAEVGFHRGRIISAWTPESKRRSDKTYVTNLSPSRNVGCNC